MVESRVSFVQVAEYRQIFLRLDIFFCTYRKTAGWFNHRLYYIAKIMSRCEFGLGFLILVTLWIPRHVTTCVFLSISFQFLTQRLLSCKTQQDSAYGWILGQFCAGNRTQTNIFTPWHVFVCGRKQRPRSTIGCIMLQTQHHDANLY